VKRHYKVTRAHALCYDCGYVRALKGDGPFPTKDVKLVTASAHQHSQDHPEHDVRLILERQYKNMPADAATRRRGVRLAGVGPRHG
jgi:hypothetical protein